MALFTEMYHSKTHLSASTYSDESTILGLMPLGGEEINSGYKGYGLGMLVDLLCGLMSGSNYGPHVRHWSNYIDQVANLGQFFVAIDPNCFAPGFSDRLQVSPNS